MCPHAFGFDNMPRTKADKWRTIPFWTSVLVPVSVLFALETFFSKQPPISEILKKTPKDPHPEFQWSAQLSLWTNHPPCPMPYSRLPIVVAEWFERSANCGIHLKNFAKPQAAFQACSPFVLVAEAKNWTIENVAKQKKKHTCPFPPQKKSDFDHFLQVPNFIISSNHCQPVSSR